MNRKVALVGEWYSNNLGDGVIVDCLEYLLRRIDHQIDVCRIDLSGRSALARSVRMPDSGSFGIRNRLARSVPRLSSIARWCLKVPVRKQQLSEIKDADLMIFGGGQILMDNNLRFPLDVLGFVRAASKYDVPIAFYCCGVGQSWSTIGAKLLGWGLKASVVKFISVRDTRSAEIFRERFKAQLPFHPVVGIDPAVWASEVYGVGVKKGSGRRIGLGVMGFRKLREHSYKQALDDEAQLISFWVDVAIELSEKGLEPRLFTNGAPEDYKLAHQVVTVLRASYPTKGPWRDPVEPVTPSGLVNLIATFDQIVAHRLHASIIAFSLQVPAVSLAWDAKVESFNESVGCSEWTVTADKLESGHVVEKVINGLHRECREDALRIARERALNTLHMLFEGELSHTKTS